MDLSFTRPVRAAAQIVGTAEESVEHLFREARIAVRLEDRFADNHDARDTFILTANQCLRFCPNVDVYLPRDAPDLLHQFRNLKYAIYGEGCEATDHLTDISRASAIVNIGTTILTDLPSTTVNSSGWVARVSGAVSDQDFLSWNRERPNVLGAYAAACLGTSQAFLRLLNQCQFPNSFEISLFNYETGAPGSIDTGPVLPSDPLTIDAWLVGCGGVSNGWAYTVRRLPIKGNLIAVDREALRSENIGPYVAATRKYLSKPKVDLIGDLLHPAISVTPYLDEWEFFKIRLKYGLAIPSLIISGLDNVETRHSVQRIWPKCLIDLGAEGLTSQVLVKRRGTKGLCLLEALTLASGDATYSQRISRQTGLQTDRITNAPTTKINEKDVASAPAEIRQELEVARQKGQLVCGYILHKMSETEEDRIDFAPAVPFVTAFSGIVGAAETMKTLMGIGSKSLHFQHSFLSGRARPLHMECAEDCECASRAA